MGLHDCNGGHGCAGADCACPCHFTAASERLVVFGSDGEFAVDGMGRPVGEVPTEYGEFVRWDVAEWLRFWGYSSIEAAPGTADVLDLGAWRADGSYVPAEADWRGELATLDRGAEEAAARAEALGDDRRVFGP